MATETTSPDLSISTPATFDPATERHFQAWLDSYARDDERREVEQAIRALVAEEPERLERESWPEIHSAAVWIREDAEIAARDKAAREQRAEEDAARNAQRAEYKRRERNRKARERNQTMRDLGMRKTRYGWG